jgi:hypothetical protein
MEKPGYKTTEFWLAVVAGALGATIASGGLPSEGPWVQAVALLQTALISMGYTGARLALKSYGE